MEKKTLTLRDIPQTRKGKPDERSIQFLEWRDQQREQMMYEDKLLNKKNLS